MRAARTRSTSLTTRSIASSTAGGTRDTSLCSPPVTDTPIQVERADFHDQDGSDGRGTRPGAGRAHQSATGAVTRGYCLDSDPTIVAV